MGEGVSLSVTLTVVVVVVVVVLVVLDVLDDVDDGGGGGTVAGELAPDGAFLFFLRPFFLAEDDELPGTSLTLLFP